MIGAALRIVGYGLAGFLLLALVFAVLLVISIAGFGMSLVRSDLFALLAGGYWLLGLSAVVIGAVWLGAMRPRT